MKLHWTIAHFYSTYIYIKTNILLIYLLADDAPQHRWCVANAVTSSSRRKCAAVHNRYRRQFTSPHFRQRRHQNGCQFLSTGTVWAAVGLWERHNAAHCVHAIHILKDWQHRSWKPRVLQVVFCGAYVIYGLARLIIRDSSRKLTLWFTCNIFNSMHTCTPIDNVLVIFKFIIWVGVV